jgi:hypothetical protein
MKGGVNIWVALRDTQDSHRAWLHIDRPYTQADLPRSIDEAPREKRRPEVAAAAGGPEIVADATSKAARDQAARGGGKAKYKSAIEQAIELESRHEAKDFGGVVML